MPSIRVLSVKQPWATLIVRGVKRFEARTWPPKWRGRIAIHASSTTIAKRAWQELVANSDVRGALAASGLHDLADVQALPRSAIVGAVTVSDARIVINLLPDECTDLDCALSSAWPPDILWRLTDPVEMAPINGIDGKLNLWTLDGPQAAEVVRRASSRRGWSGEPHDDSEVQKARDEEQAEIERSRAYVFGPASIPKALQAVLGTGKKATVADAFKPLLAELLKGESLTFGSSWERRVPVTGPIGAILVPGRRQAKLSTVCVSLAEQLRPEQPVPGYLMQFLSASSSPKVQ
jgi:hypothetical protein